MQPYCLAALSSPPPASCFSRKRALHVCSSCQPINAQVLLHVQFASSGGQKVSSTGGPNPSTPDAKALAGSLSQVCITSVICLPQMCTCCACSHMLATLALLTACRAAANYRQSLSTCWLHFSSGKVGFPHQALG